MFLFCFFKLNELLVINHRTACGEVYKLLSGTNSRLCWLFLRDKHHNHSELCTHASRCSGSPAPPPPASGSVSCGKTPELRSGPFLILRCRGSSPHPPLAQSLLSPTPLLALRMLEPVCRTPRSAHPKSKHRVPPRVQTAACFVVTIKAPHREKVRMRVLYRASKPVQWRKRGDFPRNTAWIQCSGSCEMGSWERSVGCCPGGAEMWRMLRTERSERCSTACLLFTHELY